MEYIKRNKIIYVLTGKAGSGKNKVAELLGDIYRSKDKKAINVSYAFSLKIYAKNIIDWDGNENDKPRDFLQHLGIDLIKNQIDDKMLINRVIEDIKVYSYFYDVITISDARFLAEIEDIKNNFSNVKVIHIYGKNNNLTEEQRNHISEIALDNYHDYDYVIDNNENVEELKQKLTTIVEENMYE